MDVMQLRRNLLMQQTSILPSFSKAYLSNPSNYVNELAYYFYTPPIKLKTNTSYKLIPSSTNKLNTSDYYVLRINTSATEGNMDNTDTVKYPVVAGTPGTLSFTTGSTGEIRFGVYRINIQSGQNSLQEFMSIDWTLNEN